MIFSSQTVGGIGDDLARGHVCALPQTLDALRSGGDQFDARVGQEVFDQPVQSRAGVVDVLRILLNFLRLERLVTLLHERRQSHDAVQGREQFMRQRQADVAAQVLQFFLTDLLHGLLLLDPRVHRSEQFVERDRLGEVSSAPSVMPWRIWDFSAAPERKMNGMVAVAGSPRRSDRTAEPSMPGIRPSHRTRSGSCFRASSTPAGPSPAEITWYPCESSTATTNSRTSVVSSMIRTLFTVSSRRSAYPFRRDWCKRQSPESEKRNRAVANRAREDAARVAMLQTFGAAFTSMCRSRSCRAVTGAGESVIRHTPLAVFGKAITSRMLGVLQRIAMRRSKPKAMPPCGGAP